VKVQAVVEALLRQLDEVARRFRHFVDEQLDFHVAARRF
jgi:hypothetical protein